MKYNYFSRFFWGLHAVDFSRSINRMPVPFTNGTSRENGERVLNNIIIAPVAGAVDIGRDHDWGKEFEGAVNSKNLWFHSLPFVGDLLAAYEKSRDSLYLKKLFELIASYIKWLSSNRNSPAWSDEHAVSNRARILCYVLYLSEKQPFGIPPSVFSLINKSLIEHGEWLRDDKYYVYNNHGTMADRALIEITLSPTSLSDQLVENWQNHALTRLYHMLKLTFDEDGCCVENSPSYHVFNTYLFSAINDFLVDNGIHVDQEGFSAVLAKAKSVMPLFFRKNGTYSLIGDTEIRPTHWVDTDKMSLQKGTGFFPKSGFFIHKGDNLYITAKCGGSSFSHKHIDDTSITLNYDGEDFIVDSGYLNYDVQNDRMSRYLRSFKSHSGIFTEACDKVRFANFSNPSDLGVIDRVDASNALWKVSMISRLDPEAFITRTIVCEKENLIRIEDRVKSANPVNVFQQFIIHPKCSINIDGNKIRLQGSRNAVLLSFESPLPFKIVQENCSVSETFGKIDAAKRISVVSQSTEVALNATVTVEENIGSSVMVIPPPNNGLQK